MTPPNSPPNEAQRLAALRRYVVLDTLPEQALDDLTALAAQICETPIALISLVDEHRQWFKSNIGLNLTETPREISFCTHTIAQPDLFIVPDATQDKRFDHNPLVTGETGVRFYAGAPLVTPEGAAIGALCVKDHVPRTLTPLQQQTLRVLSRQAMTHLELQQHTRSLVASEERLRIVTDNAQVGLVIVNRDRRYVYANSTYGEILGLPSSTVIGQRVPDVLGALYEEQIRPRLDRAFAGEPVEYDLHKVTPEGEQHFAVRYEPTVVNGEVTLVVVVISDVTAREETEKELRISLKENADLHAALDEHAIVARTDARGKITFVNDKFCEISQYAREELLGRDHRVINSGHHPKEFMRSLWETIRSGKVWHGEIKNRAKDGSFYWVATTIVPFLDESGKPEQYVAIRADITARKRVEEDLRQSLKEIGDLKASLDEHAIVAATDPQGRITYVNDKFCAISKYSREELLGQDHRIINSGFHPTEFIRDLWTTIAHGRVWHGEIKNRAKDGSFYWVDTTIVPFLNDKGKPRQYVAIRADITERKRVEEDLRQSLKEIGDLKAALDEHAIVAMTDPQGRITYVNDKFCAISKYSREELLGQDHRIINSGFHPTEFIRDLWTTIAHGRVWHGEIKNRAKDGSFYWVDTTIVPFLDERGKPRQYVAIRADITERKRVEEKLWASLRQVGELETALDEHAIVAITDPQGRITYANDKFCAISKYSREELLGQDHRIINSGFHPPEFIRDLWATIGQGRVWHGQIKNRAKDGNFYWVDTTIVPFLNEQGKPTQYVAIRADITEHKRIEEELRKSEDQFRTMANSIPQLAWMAQADGSISWYNDRWYAYTGTTPEQMEGWGWQSVHDPDILPSVLEKWRLALATGQPFEMEFPLRGADGKFRSFLNRGQPLRDSQGNVVRWFGTNTDVDELKQVAESLRDAQARLKSTLSAGAIGTWTWDIVHDRLIADEFTARRFSVDAAKAAEGLPAEAYLQAIFEEDRPAVAAALERAIQTRSLYDIEYRVRQRDGTLGWLQARGRVEGDESGNAVSFHGAVVDIAERKRTEAARQVSETRYRTLFDNAPDGIVIADMEGHYLDANPTICGMLGYSREEMLAKSVVDVVVPTEISHIAPAFEEVATRTHHREWQFRCKDGSSFAAEVTATLMPNGFVMGMVRDITERKRAQERIAEQAEFLDKAQDAILVRDLQGNIRFWNRGAERMYGWTAEEAIGRYIGDVLYADPHVFEEFNHLTITQGEWHGELKHQTRHRGEISIEARWTLIRDDAGQPKAVLAINTDITDKKKIEAQFLRAQRMESIGTLAGGIAHDLNNVLGPILMSLDILKMKFPDRSSQELISIISTSAQRGADMVRQVLSFARGVEGRRMEVQLKHLIQDMEKIANDTFLKHIQVRTIIPPDLWTVLGDPTQLHQVLLNLCVNARDAMPDGGVLTLSAENLTLDAQYAGMNLDVVPGPYIVLQVEDSGTGMPPEVIEKIFDPFFTTKEIGKGTGLGLSTSMAIVKSHGGFVRVYSEPGRGTKFKVYLPAQTESSPEALAEVATSMPRGNGQIILVVDDEVAVRQITEQTLQAYGYRVILACDGAEAVAIFARQGTEIAAVLTDMMMPIMDGPATIQALQRMSPKTPIIAASGLTANGNAARTANLGIKHFLPKPYTAETLLKILQEVLRETPT